MRLPAFINIYRGSVLCILFEYNSFGSDETLKRLNNFSSELERFTFIRIVVKKFLRLSIILLTWKCLKLLLEHKTVLPLLKIV